MKKLLRQSFTQNGSVSFLFLFSQQIKGKKGFLQFLMESPFEYQAREKTAEYYLLQHTLTKCPN